MLHCRLCNIKIALRAASNEPNEVSILAEPAVSRYLKQVCSAPWVWHQYPSQQVSCVWCNVLGEGQSGRSDILIQEVNVVTFWIRWVVVEGEVTGEHGVL